MRILDIQNLQLSRYNFYISINELNLENDIWYIETLINRYFQHQALWNAHIRYSKSSTLTLQLLH